MSSITTTTILSPNYSDLHTRTPHGEQKHNKTSSESNPNILKEKFPNKWYLAEAILRDSNLGKKDGIIDDSQPNPHQESDVITRALTHLNTRERLEEQLKELDPGNHISEQEKSEIEQEIPRRLRTKLKFSCINKIFQSVLCNVNEAEAQQMTDCSKKGKIENFSRRKKIQREFNQKQSSTYTFTVYYGKKSYSEIVEQLIIEVLEKRSDNHHLQINNFPTFATSDVELDTHSEREEADQDKESKVPEIRDSLITPAFSITIEDISKGLE